MSELFSKNEINPTVKVVISMNQDEKNEFKKFADEMNLPFSVLVRLALKNFIKKDGALYVEK